MPKTYREQLDELEIGESLPIEESKRVAWANTITAMHRDTFKQFTIRTNRVTREVSIWRLDDWKQN